MSRAAAHGTDRTGMFCGPAFAKGRPSARHSWELLSVFLAGLNLQKKAPPTPMRLPSMASACSMKTAGSSMAIAVVDRSFSMASSDTRRLRASSRCRRRSSMATMPAKRAMICRSDSLNSRPLACRATRAPLLRPSTATGCPRNDFKPARPSLKAPGAASGPAGSGGSHGALVCFPVMISLQMRRASRVFFLSDAALTDGARVEGR